MNTELFKGFESYGDYIQATEEELVKILGEPVYKKTYSGRNKKTWLIITQNLPFALENSEDKDKTELLHWGILVRHPWQSMEVKKMLLSMLGKEEEPEIVNNDNDDLGLQVKPVAFEDILEEVGKLDGEENEAPEEIENKIIQDAKGAILRARKVIKPKVKFVDGAKIMEALEKQWNAQKIMADINELAILKKKLNGE